jgi:hypothetical protein
MQKVQQIKESTIENHFIAQAKAIGGVTVKLRFLRGWPDRLVLLPGGKAFFVEFKRPVGGRFEPLQKRVHQSLERLGFIVWLCRNKEENMETLEHYGYITK